MTQEERAQPAEQVSDDGMELLWQLTEKEGELNVEERALLAIALRELEQRRDSDRG